MRSNNPVFRKALNNEYYDYTNYEAATYKGVIRKTLYFIIMTIVGAAGGIFALSNNTNVFQTMLIFSISTTTIFSLLAMFFPNLTKVFGTLYCLGEGLLVGVVSLYFEDIIPGVVSSALLSTIVALLVIVTLFMTNVVKVNSRFIRFLMTVTISVILSQLILWIFAPNYIDNFGSSVLVSLIMVFIATLYIFFDLENIRRVVEGNAPDYLEWYVSFGLVFTIVWLYMEVLPLIARIFLNRD